MKRRGTQLLLADMVFDSECMLTDPVSMLDRLEREKMDMLLERHQHVDR